MIGRNYDCGIGPAMRAIGGKWKVAILCELIAGELRFSEIRRRVSGATEKMLVQHLRELEQDGLVIREVFHQVPPRVEYKLTDWGKTLNEALGPLADWGERYADETGRYPDIQKHAPSNSLIDIDDRSMA